MANAARKPKLALEERGLVRASVFPNKIRDVRKERGFKTLQEFADRNPGINYTRLAKIERGEVFPGSPELAAIAAALKVSVGRLLIDTQDTAFDREKWARENVESKGMNRGGDLEAMLVGAAMRVCRYRDDLAATDLQSIGLPVATVSRIENAERPMGRWNDKVKRAIARVLGCRSMRKALAKVHEMYRRGELDDMLAELFSRSAIADRNNRRMRALLSNFPADPIAAKILELVEPAANIEAIEDAPAPAPGVVKLPVLGATLADDHSFTLLPTGKTVLVPQHLAQGSFAVLMSKLVLGPGLPINSVLIFKWDVPFGAGDIVGLVDEKAGKVTVLSVINVAGTLSGFQLVSNETPNLSNPGERKVARLVTMIC